MAIARLCHDSGCTGIHQFAVPHHFKGTHDGAGRDERDNLVRLIVPVVAVVVVACHIILTLSCSTSSSCSSFSRNSTVHVQVRGEKADERMPTTWDVYDYNVRTRVEPTTSGRNARGQYSFDKIRRLYIDTKNDKTIRSQMQSLEHHQGRSSSYRQLDTSVNNEATPLKNPSLYTQFGSFHTRQSNNSYLLSMREFPCGCKFCVEFEWEKCINKSICGCWTTQQIRPVVAERGTVSGLEEFARALQKGDVIAVLGHVEDDDIDEDSRAASYWLGVMEVGVQRNNSTRDFAPKEPYVGTSIPPGDFYTRVVWFESTDAVNLSFRRDVKTPPTYVNLYSVIRVADLSWARHTTRGAWLHPVDHNRIIKQALEQLRAEDEDGGDDTDSDDEEEDNDEEENNNDGPV